MPRTQIHNEPELLIRLAQSDEKAYTEIIDHYGSVIYGHCLMYVKDAGLAEEITQDILFSIWKQRAELPSISNFAGYVYRMTRNRSINAFKSKLAATEPPADHLKSWLHSPDASIEYKQLSEAIARGVELLPARRQQVFKMSRYEGLSYEEIAQQLNIAKSTVKDHILEALVFLRTYIKEEYGIVTISLFWLASHSR
ncbi:RNA polymerase sigma factor [Pseudobacter ginsenosidimutans]|uniref:RNA polymerase sigma-70 factor (ECF subfamily) n=1 Tax=Pseudobacter ginsenosidimutans TaxID=661488 RepID=A0A4Q7MLS3_9BACT|nr:sigma-70 family RNA polymerase sigma factor [Pseudobacter ginsenosidimutans]RZS69361.1 RNA polymerase sigma-70 factor (ECF subfamily) [Pseudobacter ginsenosidimutans]